MIVEIKKTESGCTYKFDDAAYMGKSEKEHEKVINDVSTIINEHLRSRKDKTAQAVERGQAWRIVVTVNTETVVWNAVAVIRAHHTRRKEGAADVYHYSKT